MTDLLKIEMGGTNVRLYGYESIGYVGSANDFILFAHDVPQINAANGWIYSKNFLPYSDNTYTLGYSPSYRWKHLYLSGNVLVDGLVDGVDVGSHDHGSGAGMGPAVIRHRAGLAADRPASGIATGDMYFATDTYVLSYWDGAAWRTVALT